MAVVFKSHIKEVRSSLTRLNDDFLEASGLLVTSEAKVLCPVDTGNLRRSIHHLMNKNKVFIGTDVEYAIDVEKGNSKQKSQPYLTPAGLNNINKLTKLAYKIYGGMGK